jgi:uncharacterized membrane protein YbhN (UPF0104 family)
VKIYSNILTKKNSPNLKRFISALAFVLIAGGLGFYLKKHWSDFKGIEIVSWWSLVGLVILTPLSFLISAFYFRKSLEPYPLRLPFKECFGLVMMTLMGNYTIPFSGFGMRAVYLKKIHGFAYRNFLTNMVVNWITNFLIYTSAGIIALIVYYWRTHQTAWTMVIIFFSVMIISLASFIPLKINPKKKRGKFLSNLVLPLILWQKYIKHRGILKSLLLLTFWQFLAATLMFYFAYLTFGFKITFIDSILPNTLSLYTSVIRVVPASLGFYEAAVAYPSKFLGLSLAQGLAVAALTRLVTIFWTFALGLWFSYILIEPMKKEAK